MNIIEELYYGNINPNEKRFNPNTQYESALKRLCENEKKLTEKLSDKELEMFNELINASDEINAVSSVENFKIGFRLGVKMMCNSLFYDKNEEFRD